MAENSAIEWTDHTLNFWQGCRPVSPGCANCYMYRDKRRYGQDPAVVVRSKDATFRSARKWKDPAKVFVCSWSDFFIEDADAWREEAWAEIRMAPHLTWLILTKRPENIAGRLPSDWGDGWPNVWVGVTAENQEMADERIPILLQVPAAVRFISVEPMLEPVDLTRLDYGPTAFYNSLSGEIIEPGSTTSGDGINKLSWVICGGESGPGARPMHPDWVRSLRDQCQTSGTPFLFKQHGEWLPFYDRDRDDPDWRNIPTETSSIRRLNLNGGHGFHGDRVVYFKRVGKKNAGRLLDGREWKEFPV